MKVSVLLTQAIMAAVLVVSVAPTTHAALTIKLNATDLVKLGPGPLSTDIGVLINWDGTGTNLISGLTFDVIVPANVTLPDATLAAGTPANPLSFEIASVTARSVAFVNIAGNVAPLANGDNPLTTLRFNVNAATGDFPIGLSLVNVLSGSNFTDITNQATASGSTLRVVVPEPSSFAALAMLTLGGCGWRRRSC